MTGPKSRTLPIMTPRRIEILRLAANGNTNAAIAQHLFISQNTVIDHMRDVFAVLGARDRAHAVALGLVRGFIRPSDVDWRGALADAAARAEEKELAA